MFGGGSKIVKNGLVLSVFLRIFCHKLVIIMLLILTASYLCFNILHLRESCKNVILIAMNLLIKFSGEFFDEKDGLTHEGLEILNVVKKFDRGYIVVGGGNRVRGRDSSYFRPAADNIGVISTLMNGFILQENLIENGMKVKLFSHFADFGIPYSAREAMRAFQDGHWVIFASGLGKVAYISTDVNSVVKALEIKADAVIKITAAGGVFDKDPKKHSNVRLIRQISHEEAIKQNLAVMDLAAIAIAAENKLPIAVMNIKNFLEFMNNKNVGSIIGTDWR